MRMSYALRIFDDTTTKPQDAVGKLSVSGKAIEFRVFTEKLCKYFCRQFCHCLSLIAFLATLGLSCRYQPCSLTLLDDYLEPLSSEPSIEEVN